MPGCIRENFYEPGFYFLWHRLLRRTLVLFVFMATEEKLNESFTNF